MTKPKLNTPNQKLFQAEVLARSLELNLSQIETVLCLFQLLALLSITGRKHGLTKLEFMDQALETFKLFLEEHYDRPDLHRLHDSLRKS
jgi:hypothetical protein